MKNNETNGCLKDLKFGQPMYMKCFMCLMGFKLEFEHGLSDIHGVYGQNA